MKKIKRKCHSELDSESIQVNKSRYEKDYKRAFTLAETLITLGIIGVVAAMTIPNLMNAHKAARYRSQFLKSYSTLQQAFRLMQEDDVSTDPATYAHGTYYQTFRNYLKGTLDCGRININEVKQNPCWTRNAPIESKTYKSLDKKSNINTGLLDDGQLVLPDGTNVYFENVAASGGYLVLISVDINGYMSPPNRWGYDLFTFQLIDGELKVMGDKNTIYTNPETYCNPAASNSLNGIACAVNAKNNTDYFKKIIKELK